MPAIHEATYSQGTIYQSKGEEIVYSINVPSTWTKTVNTASAKIYDQTGTDLTSSLMTGAATVAGQVVSLPRVKSLTDGIKYTVRVSFTDASSQVFEAFFYVMCQD